MKDNEDTPAFMAAEKQTGFALTHRERHIALSFWNAEKSREQSESEAFLKERNRKLRSALKEAEAGLESAIIKIEAETADKWERSSPLLALKSVREALG